VSDGCSGAVKAEVFGTSKKCAHLGVPGYDYVRVTCYDNGHSYGVTVYSNDKCTHQNPAVDQPQVFDIGQCHTVPTRDTAGQYTGLS
jgi:hypothetical protein